MSGRQKRLLVLFAALGTALVVVGGRQLLAGERAMAKSDAALEHGDVRGAIFAAREAAEALLPGSPFPGRGYARLGQIAHDAEARGDDAIAALAWRSARAAAVETRAAFVSNETQITEANAGILRAAGHLDPKSPPSADELDRTRRPAPWEGILVAGVVVALFAAWERLVSRSSRPPEARP